MGEESQDVASRQQAPDRPFGHFLHRNHMVPLDGIIVVVVGLFTVFWLPLFVVNTVPRMALAVGLLPLGASLLVRAARRREPAAIAALVCIAVTVVSALFAEARAVAFIGQLPEWVSVAALVTSLLWWPLGRSLSTGGQYFLAKALAAGAVVNGLVSIAQLIMGERQAGSLFLSGDRGSGLMINPAFYGTVMVGIAALWVGLACERGSLDRVLMCGLLSGFAALSGGRVVLIAVVATVLVSLAIWRMNAVRPVLGVAAGVLIAEVFARAVGDASSSVERLGSGESIGGRVGIWRISLDAFLDRPVFGWGPANAELAIMRGIDERFSRAYWSDGNVVIWWDPHNVGVLSLLTVGSVGVVAIGAFLISALRGRRNWPYLLAAGGIFATWMLQPFTVHSLPLFFILLGSSVRPIRSMPDRLDAGEESNPSVSESYGIPRYQWVSLSAGALLATVLLSLAFVIDRSATNGNAERAASLATVLRSDPWMQLYLSDAYRLAFVQGEGDGELLVAALEHAQAAADLYPTSSRLQRVADAAVAIDDLDTAREALEQAILLEPWEPLAHFRLALIANYLGDEAARDRLTAWLCDMGDYWCGLVESSTTLRAEPTLDSP